MVFKGAKMPIFQFCDPWSRMLAAFPGLENGEDDVNGADLIAWISEEEQARVREWPLGLNKRSEETK